MMMAAVSFIYLVQNGVDRSIEVTTYNVLCIGRKMRWKIFKKSRTVIVVDEDVYAMKKQ